MTTVTDEHQRTQEPVTADTRVAAESFRSMWGRRARTIPLMVAATGLGLLASPLLLPVAVVADLARGRRRLPTLRVALFALQYGVNDSIEIFLAPVYWLAAGFGTRLHQPASIARHRRLQRWSIDVLARRAEQLLGLRFEIEPGAVEALTPAPALVLCRHVNIVDASLPSLLYERLGHPTRGVIMAELLADPGFDLIYARTGSIFIPRDDGPAAIAAVTRLGVTSEPRVPTVIFPEGRLFRPDRLARALARLQEQHPARAERLATLRHVLPPRPGGVIALLATIPGDVVVIAHSGLDRYPSFAALARAVPLREPVRVTAWRIGRDEIPDGDDQRIAWLDQQWCEADRWIAHTVSHGA
jgi:1-acyl-sn-glycerol-3-phosphate acyltransferase